MRQLNSGARSCGGDSQVRVTGLKRRWSAGCRLVKCLWGGDQSTEVKESLSGSRQEFKLRLSICLGDSKKEEATYIQSRHGYVFHMRQDPTRVPFKSRDIININNECTPPVGK